MKDKNQKFIGKSICFLLTVAIISFLISACEREEFMIGDSENYYPLSDDEDMIVLGEELEDPYKLTNMQKAYESLKTTESDVPKIDIKPTHYYLRFLPKDNDEWDLLRSDTTLPFYDFPLHYEIVNLGTYYHDPSLPDTVITYQYCVLPVEKDIPIIQNELIYEVFIPKEGSDAIMKSTSTVFEFLKRLEYESFRLTGNLDENVLKSVDGIQSWTPQGTIKVYDQLMSMYIGLYGAQVHARRFTHTEIALTNSYGWFVMDDTFNGDVNYSIKWERPAWDIRDGILLQAWLNGPKMDDPWNLNIGTGGKSIMYATIHRAAHRHFYDYNLGLHRPFLPLDGKTKLCYLDEEGTGMFLGDWSGSGIFPDILIWGKSPSTHSYKPTNVIFGTTAHELGHQSHSLFMGNIQFWQTAMVIYESWATAVEWALTELEYDVVGTRYSSATAINYCHEKAHQDWVRTSPGWEYSPIFIDLVDAFNQRNGGCVTPSYCQSGSSLYPNDLITGYTLSGIQNTFLGDSYGLSSLRDEVKEHKISGVTDSDVDELFAKYW